MMLTTLTRTAVDVSLRVGLAPWSAVARLTRRGGQHSSLELAVDRFDASARELAGKVLSDQELLVDAAHRKAATQARATAKGLHESAEEHESEADRVASARREQAEDLREQAEERTAQRVESAEKTKARRKQTAASARQSKKQAVKKTAAKRKEAIEKEGRAARLEELDRKEEALDAREEAVTASDEADRLQASAEAKKARR